MRLDELVAAYSAFARHGEWIAPSYLRGAPSVDRRVLVSPRTAFWITDILSDPDAREYAFGRGGSLEFPFPVAAKTGSRSKELRISSPPDGSTYLIDPTLRREYQAIALRAVTSTSGSVQWSVDERSLGASESDRAGSWPLIPGRHTFRVRDTSGQIAESSIVVR